MKWFKMRVSWGAAAEHMTDEEAGRFLKALFAYIRHGEEYQGSAGREEPVVYEVLETLRDDVEVYEDAPGPGTRRKMKSDKRRGAASAPCQKKDEDTGSEYETDTQSPEAEKAPRGSSKNDDDFARFWAAYPRKQDKTHARKAFADLSPDEELLDTILDAVERQKGSSQWTRDGGQYIPLASTWIHGRRWEDEIIEEKGGYGSQGRGYGPDDCLDYEQFFDPPV